MWIMIIALLALFLWLAPLVVLWAVNTLVDAAGAGWQLPYTFEVWAATLVLMMVVGGGSASAKKG